MKNTIKSIGIITHRGNYNYGGLLQALALERWLESNGYNVDIINLNKYPINGARINRIISAILEPNKTLKHILKFRKSSKKRVLPPDSFKNMFLNYKQSVGMKYSQEVTINNIGEISSNYDALIVGSDQVWAYLNDRPLIFFLHWKPTYKGTRISYAACNPDMQAPWYNRGKIRNLLLKFDYLSVRDNTSAKWVKAISGRDSKIVADPTLLYDFNDIDCVRVINEPYIFAYILGSEINGGHSAIISKIRQKYGPIKVIAVAIPNKETSIRDYADHIFYDATPSQWISLIKYAIFIYTDSFHGCLFSLKYNKQFVAYYRELIRVSRLIDIRDRYKIDNAIISSVEDLKARNCLENGIDYSITTPLVKHHITESIDFLTNALNNK